MNKMIALLPGFVLSLSLSAQQPVLQSFDQERNRMTKRSMTVLGGWSAANIITSAFATKTHNAEMRYFHQMNVQWNSINLVFAALGYWGAVSGNRSKSNALSAVMKRQQGVEKTYLLNLGLDLAYMAGGLYMTERSKSQSNPAKLKGYGNAIIFQGGFLLLFDGVNYFLHHRHGKKLNSLLDKVEISGAPGGVSLVVKL